jgi:hypothetical protein
VGEGAASGRRCFRSGACGSGDFLDGFAKCDELGGAGFGVDFKLAAFGPMVGGIVMIDVAEEKAVLRAVDDDADVESYPDRPEVGVFGLSRVCGAAGWGARD